jgi:hypothetical protein
LLKARRDERQALSVKSKLSERVRESKKGKLAKIKLENERTEEDEISNYAKCNCLNEFESSN